MATEPIDAIDALNLLDLVEDDAKAEKILTGMIQNAGEAEQYLLHSHFLGPDRDAEYDRYLRSKDFAATLRLLRTFKVENSHKVVEIGAGAGFLSWALARSGFLDLDIFEPNAQWFTGTGYLKSRPDASSVRIFSDMKQWHATPKRYDALITKNCIHHFRNISYAAASLRQKLEPGARWFAFREFFADSAHELAHQLHLHPGCQKYLLYEWPYPAHHYVEAIELAGFKLICVLPRGYANNCLSDFSEGDDPRPGDTETFDRQIATSPQATVDSFWQEVAANRSTRPASHIYTRPQGFVFERVEINVTMTALEPEEAAQVHLTLDEPVPATCKTSDEWTMSVIVANNSTKPLAAYMPNPVNLSYHWYADSEGKPRLEQPVLYGGERSPLLPGLAAGETQPYRMLVRAPRDPGRYWLRITLVQELVRWFEGLSPASKIDIPVEVRLS